jgi:hypothetical protein
LRRFIGYPLVERQRQRQNRRRNGHGRFCGRPTERLGSLQERLSGQAHPEKLWPLGQTTLRSPGLTIFIPVCICPRHFMRH